MAKRNREATQQTANTTPEQGEKRAFKPSKKARTNLAVAPAEKTNVPPRASSMKAAKAIEGGAPSSADDGPADMAAGEAAFNRVQAAMQALPADQLRRINVYVPAAVALAIGVRPKLLGLRGAMLTLPGGAEAVDNLQEYGLAVLYAHALTLPFGEGETTLRTLADEAMPLRERLLASAELLVHFRIFDAKHVAAIRSGSGYLDTAQGLTALATLFRTSWAQVSSQTPVTMAEVDRAGQLGPLLVVALGRRQQGTDGSGEPNEAHDRLARAYTLFFNAYNKCRRAVAFLRWDEGDADDFAPTLKQQTPRRQRRAPGDEGGDEAPDAGPGGEAPTNGAPGGVPGNGAPGGDVPDDRGV